MLVQVTWTQADASRQTAPGTAKMRIVQKVSKCRERQQRSIASISEVRSEYEATRQDKAVSGSFSHSAL